MRLRNIAAAGLIAVALFGTTFTETSPPPNQPTPEANYAAAVSAAKSVAEGMDQKDRAVLAGLYSGASKAVLADAMAQQPVLATTGKLRAFHVAALNFTWRGYGENLPGKYPGLSSAVETAFAETLGTDVKGLDHEVAAKTLEALAWAFR